FEDEEKAFGFMSAMTKEHDLIFSRKVTHLATKIPRTSKLLSATARRSKGYAEIQLWRSREQKAASNNNALQLVARYDDHKVEDRWLSLPIQPETLEHESDATRVSFPKMPYQRGRIIDMASLSATDSKESGKRGDAVKKTGAISLVFSNTSDRAAFVSAVEGMTPETGGKKSPLDELMTSEFIS
ncbi:MAG: hypothetical protein Q9183_007290, partial [Haloplaca sp. 2 TL-2023]